MIAAVLACLFVGDSTALGAAEAYNRTAPVPCTVQVRVGAGPTEAARWPLPAASIGTAIVGLGSNNPTSPALAADLVRLRQRLAATRVIWLLPYDRRAAGTIERVAIAYGDYVMDLAELPSRDRLHPLTYGGVATALMRWPIQ